VTACFVWKYSCCEPRCEELRHLVTDDILLVTLLGAKTEARLMALCVLLPDTLLLKGTKHQLSICGKMPIVNGFSKACVTFQFSFWSITKRRFEKENKQDAEIRLHK
jgi:hypothetical protein